MALLGNKNDYLDEEQDELDEYQVPSVFRNNPKELSLKKSIFLSTVLHPAVVGLAWLLLFILTLMGINIALFDKPEPKPKDIEFVLVNKEQTPINKRTPFRADKNSRAGGKHDPKKRVSMPEASAPKAPAQKVAAPSPAPKKEQQKQAKQKQPQAPKKVVKKTESAASPRVAPPKHETYPTFAPRPTPTPTAPRPTAKPKSDFAIPVPKSALPKAAIPSGGPITSEVRGNGSSSGSGHSGAQSGGPSPSFSPTKSAGSGSGGGRFSGSRAGSGSGGNVGNPGPGNPKGAPGIDAIREPDFGPYMQELQRQIKRNWEPPKGNESKRVVLLFAISRDGRLLSIKVLKSSGLASADNAAKSAVQLTAPFRPLPPDYRGNSVDIQFTFDYNVFNASRY